jgi:hypothetical protein
VLSHRSAAAHWELLATSQERIDVTAPRGRQGVPGIRLNTSRCLDAQDTRSHEGIPVTTIHSTLRCSTWRQPHEQTSSSGRWRRRCTCSSTTSAPSTMSSRGPTATAETNILKEATKQEPQITRSMWEIRVLALVRGAGLPEPITNRSLHAPDHGECQPDFYWPAYDLIVETDGWEAHRTPAAFRSDRAKVAALTAARYKVLRFTWDVEDATVLRRLSAVLQN